MQRKRILSIAAATAGAFAAMWLVGQVLAQPRDTGPNNGQPANGQPNAQPPTNGTPANTANANPIDAERAYGYLKQLCTIGPRYSGSEGMKKQQALIIKHFEKLGAKVTRQEFNAKHPITHKRVKMANIIVSWKPELTERVVICAHYDTRPLPDQDPDINQRRRGRFIGANDGASGTALLMELGHHMGDLKTKWGVDFVLFDGEELVYNPTGRVGGDIGPYFLGSEYFSKQYVRKRGKMRYRWGILLDMVGDKDLQIHSEVISYRWQDTRPLYDSLWAVARQIGVEEFDPRPKFEIRDDHLAMRNIGRIPTCNVIDFEYPDRARAYWHTTNDIPANCSGESLAKVGWVVHEWLRLQP